MSGIEVGLASILLIIGLIYAGMHIPVALALVSFIGVWFIRGDVVIASKLLALAASDSISDYVFGVIPLFVLMGLLVSVSDIGLDTFNAANKLFGRLKGGLGVATVAANAVFAAVTGISIASAAVFTKVAVPEMLRLGYKPRFAVGVVAGSSILGMLIPPSLLLIVFAVLTETSVGDLFIAGIIPGTIMALAFSAGIVLLARWAPQFVGGRDEDTLALKIGETPAKVGSLKLLPIAVLIALVLGGIYGGFFTPTEAGAVGALGALLLTLARRRLTPRKFWALLVETGHVTSSICLLIIAASMYSRMLALSGLPNWVGGWLQSGGLGFTPTLLLYLLILLLLGTILDSISILLIMVPLALPIFAAFGVNLVWLGIVTVIAIEVGIITPPLGIGVFAVHSTLADERVSLSDVFIGALPFVLIMIMVLAVLVVFPSLSTVLVR